MCTEVHAWTDRDDAAVLAPANLFSRAGCLRHRTSVWSATALGTLCSFSTSASTAALLWLRPRENNVFLPPTIATTGWRYWRAHTTEELLPAQRYGNCGFLPTERCLSPRQPNSVCRVPELLRSNEGPSILLSVSYLYRQIRYKSMNQQS